MLSPPPETVGVMDVQCISLLVSILQAASVGGGGETGHETKELFRSYIVRVGCDFFNF